MISSVGRILSSPRATEVTVDLEVNQMIYVVFNTYELLVANLASGSDSLLDFCSGSWGSSDILIILLALISSKFSPLG